jgi:hypothetical protein
MAGFIVVIIVVAGIVVWVRKRRRRVKKSLDLTLAVIGFEASGKTVYIGSMFNELRVPDAHGVFLETSPEKAGTLLSLYNTTADTDKKFPNSTSKGELIEWPLTVKVKSVAGVADIGKFCYLDFAGESLRDLYTGAPNPETQRLYQRFADADILMAALDGLQVKRFMENRPLPRFYEDLGTLLALLSNHQKIVNLILTKWDILEDSYSFRQVIERLFQINQFAGFIRPGFVREDGNTMLKVSGKIINPVRVDVPIACALPDALTTARQRKPDAPGQSRLLIWASTMKLNFGMLQVDLSSLRQQPASPYLSPTVSTPAAIGQLVRYCDGRLGQFEREFPESNLVRFMIQQGI